MATAIGSVLTRGALAAAALLASQPAHADDVAAIVARTVAALSKFETAAYHPAKPEQLVPVAVAAITATILQNPVQGSACRSTTRDPARVPVVSAGFVPVAVALECAAAGGADTARLDAAADLAIDHVVKQFDANGLWLNAKRIADLLKKDSAGAGLTLKQTDAGPLVVFAPDTGPAFLAGIRIGDHLLAIDAMPVTKLPLDEVVNALRGAVGTTVNLEVVNPQGSISKFAVTRQIITAARASLEIETSTSTLRIRVVEMRAGIADLVKQEVKQRSGKFSRIVLDLRSNGGGLLSETIMLADLFLPKAPIAKIDQRDPSFSETYTSGSSEIAKGVPMDVWVDSDTAAGAEIVGAALQDNRRARIWGEKTLGVGRIATLVAIDRSHALKLTTGSTLRANDSELTTHPLIPDCPVTPQTLSLDNSACPDSRRNP